jgi:hypothetical protein
MFKVIDHKKVEMTQSEYDMYEKICKSYNTNNFKGEDLFTDLFEVNDDGLIIFVKPPVRNISFEVFLFVISLMNHQHLRANAKQVDAVCLELKQKIAELDAKIKSL